MFLDHGAHLVDNLLPMLLHSYRSWVPSYIQMGNFAIIPVTLNSTGIICSSVTILVRVPVPVQYRYLLAFRRPQQDSLPVPVLFLW
jgi:hypothetical protein